LKDLEDDRSPAAARLDAESPRRVVQVTAWDSGEVDFVVGDLETGNVLTNEHREVTSALGIRELLRDVRGALEG
jgi:hypothetical protein